MAKVDIHAVVGRSSRDTAKSQGFDADRSVFQSVQGIDVISGKPLDSELGATSIREILAGLDGVVPMDEAVIESEELPCQTLSHDSLYSIQCYQRMRLLSPWKALERVLTQLPVALCQLMLQTGSTNTF